jgi:hypothetical protein
MLRVTCTSRVNIRKSELGVIDYSIGRLIGGIALPIA